MPSPIKYTAQFYCKQFYHIVFKSIDGLLLFKNDLNKTFFLEKFLFFTKPIFNSQAYCVLDNHVHFIISVNENNLLQKLITDIPDEIKTVTMKKFLLNPENELLIDELIERQVNRFMVSYANSYNKVYKRKGGLFQSPFRRSLVSGDAHLQQAIIYVHANAQKHGFTKDYRTWPHSSYKEILCGKSLFVDVTWVLDFFGDAKKFVDQHEQQVSYFYANNWPSSKIEVN